MKLINQFVLVIGPPGVGKFTVGTALASRMSAKLVDNHYWLNPVFGLIEQNGVTPISKEVWDQVNQLRAAVLNTIANISPHEWNFVFTLAFMDVSRDEQIAKEIFAAADRRSANVLIVRLTCKTDELARRITIPERRLRFKEADPAAGIRSMALPLFDTGSRKTITIDTTDLSPESTVERIMREGLNLRTL